MIMIMKIISSLAIFPWPNTAAEFVVCGLDEILKNRMRILAFVNVSLVYLCFSAVAHVSFFLPFGMSHLFPLCCVVLYRCVFLPVLEFRISFLLFFPRLFRYVFSVFAYVFACVMIYYLLLINAYLVCGCVAFFFCVCVSVSVLLLLFFFFSCITSTSVPYRGLLATSKCTCATQGVAPSGIENMSTLAESGLAITLPLRMPDGVCPATIKC